MIRTKRTEQLDAITAKIPLWWDSYSPGDGVTRYRFFSEPMEYFGSNGIATVLGLAAAVEWARAYRDGYWAAQEEALQRERHQRYTNFETFGVALILNNVQWMHEHLRDIALEPNVLDIDRADRLRALVEELVENQEEDMAETLATAALDRVDWADILRTVENE